jgi:hypothetical protein
MRYMDWKSSRLLLVGIPLLVGMCWLSTDGLAQSDCQRIKDMARNSPNADSPIVVSMQELRDNAERYYGKTVRVEGEMHRIFTDKVFTIEGGDRPNDFDVLIVGNVSKDEAVKPMEGSTAPDQDVQVTGVVAPYDRGQLECAYGPLNVDTHEGRSFTKSPVLIVEKPAGPTTERLKPMAPPSTPKTQPSAPPY